MNMHPVMAQALAPFAPAASAVHKRNLPTFWVGNDIKVKVDYDYQPGEPAVYDIESPACGPAVAPEVEINEVWLGDTDITELLGEHVIESLTTQILAGVAS